MPVHPNSVWEGSVCSSVATRQRQARLGCCDGSGRFPLTDALRIDSEMEAVVYRAVKLGDGERRGDSRHGDSRS